MRIKAVLFDIDGTLVDSNDRHVRAWDEAFRAGGYHFDDDAIHAQIGKGTDMLVPALLPEAHDDLVETLGEAHGAIFKSRYLERVRAFPHARDLLVRTHEAGMKVVLASSASKAELDYYVALLNIQDIVSASTSADDVENSKPAPDIFGVALKKVAPIKPEEALVVGDTPYDVRAAAKCGIRTVAVRSGKFPEAMLHEAGPIAIYDDAAALLSGFDSSPLAQ